VIAVQNFQEQCVLVAKGRIEARLGEAGGRGDVVERSALESFSPDTSRARSSTRRNQNCAVLPSYLCTRCIVKSKRAASMSLPGGNLHQGWPQTAAPPDGGVTGRRNRMRWYSQPIATSNQAEAHERQRAVGRRSASTCRSGTLHDRKCDDRGRRQACALRIEQNADAEQDPRRMPSHAIE